MNPNPRSNWALLGGLFLVLFFTPIAALFTSWNSIDLELWDHISKTILAVSFLNTLYLVAVVLFVSLIIGVPLAWFSSEGHIPAQLNLFFILPLAIPKYVFGYSYLSLIDYAGPLQIFLRGLGLDVSPYLQTGTLGPTGIVLGFALFPYIFLLFRHGISSIDPDLLNSARLMGQSRLTCFFKIVLPLSFPWLVSGMSLVVLETVADFGAVSIFNYDTVSTLIYRSWFGLQSLDLASQIGSVVSLLIFLLLFIQTTFFGSIRSSFSFTSPKYFKPQVKLTSLLFSLVVLGLSSVLPVGYLSYLALDRSLWSSELIGLILNTVFISGLTAASVMLLSLIVSVGPLNQFLAFLKILPKISYALPGIIVATGTLKVIDILNQSTGVSSFAFQASMYVMVIALTVKFATIGIEAIAGKVKSLPRHIEESAQLMGASSFEVFKDIRLPNLVVVLGIVSLLVFVETAKEMPITLMTRSIGNNTLAVKIFEYTSEGQFELAAPPSLTLCLVSLCIGSFVLKKNSIKSS